MSISFATIEAGKAGWAWNPGTPGSAAAPPPGTPRARCNRGAKNPRCVRAPRAHAVSYSREAPCSRACSRGRLNTCLAGATHMMSRSRPRSGASPATISQRMIPYEYMSAFSVHLEPHSISGADLHANFQGSIIASSMPHARRDQPGTHQIKPKKVSIAIAVYYYSKRLCTHLTRPAWRTPL